MSENNVPSDAAAQNAIVREAWNANAAFWDERMGDGNDFHLKLIRPAVEALLELQPGERVLDAACGNGLFARRLVDLGATVVAFDFEALIERARARNAGYEGRIDYRVLDATDVAQLRALEGPFDAIVCNMGLMDMADIGPMIDVGRELLRPDGRFVFAVTHPCFNSNHAKIVAERSQADGATQFFLKLAGYKEELIAYGDAIVGQPKKQLYFDRPLESLLGAFFRVGYVLDGLLEPAFDPPEETNLRPNWDNLWRVPPVLVARMRLHRRGVRYLRRVS